MEDATPGARCTVQHAVADASPHACHPAVAAAMQAKEDTNAKSRWADTIQRCSSAIVVLRVALVTAFGECCSTFQHATGFVVDAERGIILTNRHVGTTIARRPPRSPAVAPLRVALMPSCWRRAGPAHPRCCCPCACACVLRVCCV